MEVSILIIIFGGYLALCFLVGMYAKSKGRSLVLFTLVSVFISPIIGFLIALVVSNERKAKKQHEEMMNAMATQTSNNG